MIVPGRGGIRWRAGTYLERRHDNVDAFPGYAEGRAQIVRKLGGKLGGSVSELGLLGL